MHSPLDLPPDRADHTPVLIQLRPSSTCPAAGSVPGDYDVVFILLMSNHNFLSF